MRPAIIPLFAVIIGLGIGVAATRDKDVPQASSNQAAAPPSKAGGVTDPSPAGGKPDPKKAVQTGGAPVDKTYTIGAEDVLQVWVIEQAGISGQYPVRADGIISIPMVGDVNASGLTTEQLTKSIVDRLKAKEILNDPSVTVGVFASHSRKFYISGEVNKPGAFDLVLRTRVSEALVQAGGFREFANTKKIEIVRTLPDGKTKVMQYNDNDVSRGKKMDQDIYLEPGDHIHVH